MKAKSYQGSHALTVSHSDTSFHCSYELKDFKERELRLLFRFDERILQGGSMSSYGGAKPNMMVLCDPAVFHRQLQGRVKSVHRLNLHSIKSFTEKARDDLKTIALCLWMPQAS